MEQDESKLYYDAHIQSYNRYLEEQIEDEKAKRAGHQAAIDELAAEMSVYGELFSLYDRFRNKEVEHQYIPSVIDQARSLYFGDDSTIKSLQRRRLLLNQTYLTVREGLIAESATPQLILRVKHEENQPSKQKNLASPDFQQTTNQVYNEITVNNPAISEEEIFALHTASIVITNLVLKLTVDNFLSELTVEEMFQVINQSLSSNIIDYRVLRYLDMLSDRLLFKAAERSQHFHLTDSDPILVKYNEVQDILIRLVGSRYDEFIKLFEYRKEKRNLIVEMIAGYLTRHDL